jgi:hypothetical protein
MTGASDGYGPALPSSAVRFEAPTGDGTEARLRALSSFEPYVGRLFRRAKGSFTRHRHRIVANADSRADRVFGA